jgi:hypothetical protein
MECTRQLENEIAKIQKSKDELIIVMKYISHNTKPKFKAGDKVLLITDVLGDNTNSNIDNIILKLKNKLQNTIYTVKKFNCCDGYMGSYWLVSDDDGEYISSLENELLLLK